VDHGFSGRRLVQKKEQVLLGAPLTSLQFLLFLVLVVGDFTKKRTSPSRRPSHLATIFVFFGFGGRRLQKKEQVRLGAPLASLQDV
jgi:hypothetical protein